MTEKQTIFKKIVGPESCTTSRQIFNLLTFFMSISMAAKLVQDLLLGAKFIELFFSGGVCLFVGVLYIFSRTKRFFSFFSFLLIFVLTLFLVYRWYFLGGIQAGITGFIIGGFIVLAMVTNKKTFLPTVLFLISVVLIMFFIEYFKPQFLPGYTEPSKSLVDSFATALLLGLGLMSVVRFFVETNITRYNVIQNLNRTLEEKNEMLVDSNDELELLLEQKEQLLESKKLLMSEMNHRIKNNLTTIGSLLKLQSTDIYDEKSQIALKESALRVKAVSNLHDLLSKTRLDEININEFLHNLVDEVKKSIHPMEKNIQFIIKCENISLDFDYLLPIALITNEVITNSLKYAFNNTDSGIITISFSKNDSGIALFEISDNGVGFPKEGLKNKTESLGMLIIQSLSEQLEGECFFKNAEKGGLYFSLQFSY